MNAPQIPEIYPVPTRLGLAALKMIAALNGIAALAALAFVTALTTAESTDLTVDAFAPALYAYCLGALFSAIAVGAMYLRELFLARDTGLNRFAARLLQIAILVLAFSAYGAFLRGSQSIYLGFYADAAATKG
jgi:hypothetical protein